MIIEAGFELPFCLPNVGGRTVIASNCVDYPSLFQTLKLVLGVDEFPSDGVEGLDVVGDSRLPDVPGYGFGHRPHIRQEDASFVPSVYCGILLYACGIAGCSGRVPY